MHIPLQVELSPSAGFTLIEMSIVLVIIGLLVGGILTGQDLIKAAAVRAQIAQIEKYQTAVNTFRNKYGGLPGDLQDPYATRFGFQSRGQYPGEGDGNGIIQGNCTNDSSTFISGSQQGCGELAVFWQDLSTAKLIDTYVCVGANCPSTTGPVVGSWTAGWLPASKLGGSRYIYLWSFGGINYFELSAVDAAGIGWSIESTGTVGSGDPGLTVQQAYNIDKKMDDGLPQSGAVTACYMDWDVPHHTLSKDYFTMALMRNFPAPTEKLFLTSSIGCIKQLTAPNSSV